MNLYGEGDFLDKLNLPSQSPAPQLCIDFFESLPPPPAEEEIPALFEARHCELDNALEEDEFSSAEIAALFESPHSDLFTALSIALPPTSPARPGLPEQKVPPKLTDADRGLRKQYTNYNLREMADGLREHLMLLNINDGLAFYRSPCWRMPTKKRAIKWIREALHSLYHNDVAYLSGTQLEDILKLLLSDPKIETLDSIPSAEPQYICFRDGLYDWRTCVTYQNAPEHHRFSFINMDAAQINCGPGEHFEAFMSWVTGDDPELRLRILEMIGVIVSGLPVKCFFYLKGPSGTGKSQLARFLRTLLGEISCYSIPDINALSDRWTTGNIAGKLLCVCADIPDKPLKPAAISVIKQITGDDPIEGERKHQPSFVYECTAKLLFVGNYDLQIPEPEQEEALLQRLIQITLPCAVEKEVQITHFYKCLLDEAGYIVGQALDALVELEKRHFCFSGTAGDSLPLAQGRTVKKFVEACCSLEPQARCATRDLYHAYCEWCGMDSVKYSLAQFGLQLSQSVQGLKPTRTSQFRGFLGITLKTSDSPA